MAAIPDKYLDLLEQKKAFASLATAMPDGSPQVTPVWFDYRDGRIRVNTAKGQSQGTQHEIGSAGRPRDHGSGQPLPLRTDSGRVGRVTEEGAASHIDSLTRKYLGQEKYPYAAPGEVRLLCEIEPISVSGIN